ncbi:hypothetical protein AAGU66_13830 [Edwardsiella ictaluri]|uniref:Uncharacterized protein n=2 Tax=Edwardsiella ictaluri TaxID=67780 RepID=C5BEU9_EDWI9|nr:hypothetical protein [Edwardsiella ictaluri]ACR70337.1 hypothetical protein NT01EI_3187 [Edwardsiella ictaluri 93-146]UCQ47233.1 hypothetical protein DB741_14650 [Edwardsiella ictaluri]UCQ50495.1 hypothetical protein DB731_14630 [Edwardsiella ictaluri]UYB61147.1 hypothetical protein N8I66_14345 [Edwardsiella ictaluri]UYB64373.1 hypothetical protein N8I67_14340 [Edwardsiella ictaluri]
MQSDASLPAPCSCTERYCNLAHLCKLQQQTPDEAGQNLSHLVSDIMHYHALSLHISRHGYRLHDTVYEWFSYLLHWIQRARCYFPAPLRQHNS